MRFHLIDRVDLAASPASRSRAEAHLAQRGVLGAEDDGLAMPPPFVLEALCQAATWLIMITTERRKRAALLSIGSVEFLGDVRPGDVLELDGDIDSLSDEMAVVSGRVTVDGEIVLEAREVMCALIDADQLADLDDTKRLQDMLTRAARGEMIRVAITGIGAVTPVGRDDPAPGPRSRRDAAASGRSPPSTRARIRCGSPASSRTSIRTSSSPTRDAIRHLHRGERFGVAAAC